MLFQYSKEMNQGKDFRVGHRYNIDGSDLIIWIQAESTQPLEISISPDNL